MPTRLLGATGLVLVAAVNPSSARAEGRNYQVEPRGPAYHCVSTTTLHLFRHRLPCRAPEPTA